MDILIHWLLNALVILVVAHLVPGLRVRDFKTALVVALVLGVLTALLTWPLALLGTILGGVLLWPALVATLGLILFVIYWAVRFLVMLCLLRITASVVSGFTIDDGPALITGAVLIAFFHALVTVVLH